MVPLCAETVGGELVIERTGQPQPLRVLHVTSGLAPRLGGPSKAALEMCQALAGRGLHVVLFTTNLDERGRWSPFAAPKVLEVPTDRSVHIGGLEIRYFPTKWPSRFVFSPAMASALRRRMREFDIIHVHSLYLFPTLAAAHYARRYGVPYIIRPHGTLDPYLRRRHRLRKMIYGWLIERRNLDSAAAVHFTSQDEADLVRPLGIKSPGLVVPLGVNTAEFEALPPRGTYRGLHPWLQGKQLVVFLGRLTPKKGLDLLVRAFAQVARKFPDAHLVIAGPDDEDFSADVRTWLKQAGVFSRTSMPGMLLGAEKLALLADADVWVLPSYTENFGLAAVEAMACGIPVVLTDKINIHREVSRAHAGLVVACQAEALAGAISDVLLNHSLRLHLSAAARRLVHSQFTWDAAVTELIAAYGAISLSRKSPRLEDTLPSPLEVQTRV